MTCWVRVRHLSAKGQNPVSTADRKGSRGWTGWKRCVPSVLHKGPQLPLLSPGQLGRWQWRSMGRDEVGEEESSEFRTDVRKCFFPSENCSACGMGPGSTADAMVLDPLQELSDAREIKKNRVNKGWISMACWRYCPVLSYLKCSQMCFELSFDIHSSSSKKKWWGHLVCFCSMSRRKDDPPFVCIFGLHWANRFCHVAWQAPIHWGLCLCSCGHRQMDCVMP